VNKFSGDLYEWGGGIIKDLEHNAYSDTNTNYRIMMNDMVQQSRSKDKVLCADYRRPLPIIKIHRVWLSLPNWEQKAIFGKYVVTQMVKEDGQRFTEREAALEMKFKSARKFKETLGWARKRIMGRVDV